MIISPSTLADDASKYIYGFRKDNQFSLILGFSGSKWRLPHNNTLAAPGISLQFLYRFHLQLHRKLGYFLGTSFGLNYFFPTQHRSFHSWSLPGAAAGLVWYADPRWQFLLIAEVFLERLPRLPAADTDLHGISLEAGRGGLLIEHFFSLDKAVNFGINISAAMHNMGRDEGALAAIKVQKSTLWRCTLGFSYHLL